MKTLDNPHHWQTVCHMIVDLALNDALRKRTEKTGHALIEFAARELNLDTPSLYWTSTHKRALLKIYEATREGIEQ